MKEATPSLFAVLRHDDECGAYECLFTTLEAAEATAEKAGRGYYVDDCITVYSDPRERVTLHWIQRYAPGYDHPDKTGTVELWDFEAPPLFVLSGYVAYGWSAEEALDRLEANMARAEARKA